MGATKIRSFTSFDAWKQAHKLVLMIYKITKIFPNEERFRLISQICRAVVSISSNIAEGFSRTSAKDKIHFYSMALGSLTEVQNQLLIARDLTYMDKEQFKKVATQTVIVSKLINGLIKTATNRMVPIHNT